MDSSRKLADGKTPKGAPLLVSLLVACACLCIVCNSAVCQQQPADYRLGPEDVIAVDVMGHQELSGEFLIPEDGTISLQRGGVIYVTGKTIRETSTLISDRLKGTLLDPDVVVRLKVARPQLIHVVGVVQRPGAYSTKPGWRITEAISAAGGIQPGTELADCTVNVLRAGTGLKESVPLSDVMHGSEPANKTVYADDVITIESVEMIPIYVMGHVARPGVYNLRKDSAGVLEATAMAGGTTDDAALSKVTITHLTGDSETVSILPAMLEGKQKTSVKLRSGDLVVVPGSTARFAVLGWANSPGFFALKEGETVTLSDALGMAKGVDNRRGGIKKVAIIRQVDGKQEHLIFDLSKFSKNGDVSQNPVIRAGDVVWVPETNKLDWDRTMQAISTGISLIWLTHTWDR